MRFVQLTVHRSADTVNAGECLSLSLEREIYTPYESLTGEFLADPDADYSDVTYLELFWMGESIFTGIADRVTTFRRGGVRILRVRSRTFTSLLTQNELEQGLHANLTLQDLISGFYTLPFVTAEENPGTGYIFVRDGTSLWDSVAAFVYKLSGRYPFVENNRIRFTLDAEPAVHIPAENTVTAVGTVTDSTKLISHYHMEDIQGNPNAYEQENPAAQHLQIVRHKQIGFDRQFLSNPMQALTYRNAFSCRGYRTHYVTYAGFGNEKLGDRIRYGAQLDGTICRMRMTFSEKGYRTTIWTYEDGFYNTPAE